MKVYHISNELTSWHNNTGGAEAAAESILNRMPEDHTCIVSSKGIKDGWGMNERLVSVNSPFTENGILGRMMNSFAPNSMILTKDLKTVLTYAEVVHLHKFNKFGISPIIAANELNKPIVASIYDYWGIGCPKGTYLDDDNERCNYPYAGTCFRCKVQKKLIENQMKDAYSKVNTFIALTEDSKKKIQQFVPNAKVEVIQLPITRPDFKEVAVKKNKVFWAGWISPNKGIELLLSAAALCKDIEFRFAGMNTNNKYTNQIKEECEKIGVTLTTERLSKEEYEKEFMSSNVICIPEIWDNMSPVILSEAMLLGKNVVSTKVGGIPEIVQDGKTGLLAELNAADLAAKITEAVNADFGIAAKEFAQDYYNPEKNIEKIKKVYEVLV